MPLLHVLRRPARLMLAAAALAAAAACNDSTAPAGHDDEADAIRLTIVQGGTTYGPYTLERGPSVNPSPFVIPVGNSTVTAQFLDHDGAPITDLDSDHRLQIENVVPAAAMTFTSTGQTTGTIAAPAAGTATVTVCLYHVDHCDMGVTLLPVTIGG